MTDLMLDFTTMPVLLPAPPMYRITIRLGETFTFLVTAFGEENALYAYRALVEKTMNETAPANMATLVSTMDVCQPDGTWVPYVKQVEDRTLDVDDVAFLYTLGDLPCVSCEA